MQNKQELTVLKKLIKKLDIEIIQIDSDISKNAISLVEAFHLSHSMELADALIAASCQKYNEPLCTANNKHYQVISDLKIDIFRQ